MYHVSLELNPAFYVQGSFIFPTRLQVHADSS